MVTYKHLNKHIIYNIPENRAVTWDPSGILAGPYQNRKTGTLQKHENCYPSGKLAESYKNRKTRTRDSSGTLAGPYKNRKTEIRDPSGTLRKPEKRDLEP